MTERLQRLKVLLLALQAVTVQVVALQLVLPACAALAAAEPPLALSVTPAWKGWSRPGRATELDIRLSANVPTRVNMEVAAHPIGPPASTVVTQVELQPGRPMRLQLPVGAAGQLRLRAASAAGPALEQTVTVSMSESPLLAVALAASDAVQLDAFHTVAVTADDLPRNASAYASIDALMVDAATLAALDARQLSALLAHAAACGRIAVVATDAAVRSLLEGAGGCGGRALLQAGSVVQARDALAASLTTSVPAGMTLSDMGSLARPSALGWNRVALAVALYFASALAVLLLLHTRRVPVLWLLLGAPALAAGAAWALPGLLQPAPELAVWSEGEAGAAQARYRAWQRVAGARREHTRVEIPAQLAASAQPCDRHQALRLQFDPVQGRLTAVEFETRLFRQVLLCYSGSFPMARSPQLGLGAGGLHQVRNAGASAWPQGVFLLEGKAQTLPALEPGAQWTLAAEVNAPGPGATAGAPAQAVTSPAPQVVPVPAAQAMQAVQAVQAVQTALPRVRPGGAAALWALDLGGVAAVPQRAQGWLLVSVPQPQTAASATPASTP